MRHRIAVISDTHDLLRPEIKQILQTCEVILHGGDISNPKLLEELRGIAPVYAVRGNNDKEWAAHLPSVRELELFGIRFFMTHKKKDIPAEVKADVVIFGHSHKYSCEKKGNIRYINPGSCGPRRFHQPVTMAVITTEEERSGLEVVSVEKIDIPHEKEETGKDLNAVTTAVVKKVCADVDKGIAVSEIATRHKLDNDLTQQLVRMYVTHPGVTPEQIMAKIGL